MRIGKYWGSSFFANFARLKCPQTTNPIARLWWHITFCVGGIMTKPNDVGASTSCQEHISANGPPNFCNAMALSGVACARPFCPSKHMLYLALPYKKEERYLLSKRYLVLFLRKKSWWGSSILSASSLLDWTQQHTYISIHATLSRRSILGK